jgi:hypothetical protein
MLTPGLSKTESVWQLEKLCILSIEMAISAERWESLRVLDPAKWILTIEDGDYRKGFVDGLRAAQERIAKRIESADPPNPSDPLNPSDPPNSPDPLSQEDP